MALTTAQALIKSPGKSWGIEQFLHNVMLLTSLNLVALVQITVVIFTVSRLILRGAPPGPMGQATKKERGASLAIGTTSLRFAPASVLRTRKLVFNTFHKFKVNFHIHYMPHYF